MSIDIATIPADFFAPAVPTGAPATAVVPAPCGLADDDDNPLAEPSLEAFRAHLRALAPETVVGVSNCAAICPLARWLEAVLGVPVHAWKYGYATPSVARAVLSPWWAAFIEAVDFIEGAAQVAPGVEPGGLFVESLAREVTAAEALAILDRVTAPASAV